MDFLKKKTSNKLAHIIGIVLKQEEGEGLLMSINEATGEVLIVDRRPFRYSNSWENLVYDVDELLYKIENDHSIKLKKAMFFVYSHLVDLKSGEMKPTYLETLQNIVKENGLESVGYVTYSQMVFSYLTSKEKSPPNTVIVEIDSPAVSVFVYTGGDLVFSESVAKTESLVADFEEVLAHTQKNIILPPRIIMYDSSSLEDESHQLLTHSWSKDMFMQLPKVEVIGMEDHERAIVHIYKEHMALPPAMPNEAIAQSNTPIASQDDTIAGFVIGKDIKDVQANTPHVSQTVQDSRDYDVGETSVEPQKKGIMGFTFPSIAFPSFSGGGVNRKMYIVGGLASLLVLGGIFSLLFFGHKAHLTVKFESAVIDEEIEITAGPAIEKTTDTFTISTSIETTGNKEIGEKAKGSITIFNADEDDKTFEKGAKFLTSDKLTFLLDSTVTVEGATKTVTDDGDILTTTSKETAQVTAAEIGTDHNIKKDTKLLVEGFSETTYFARSDADMTGGTQEEVRTASRDDFTALDAQIQEELDKMSEESLNSADPNRKILTDLTQVEITEETYSKEVAEEADAIDAEVTAEVTYYSYVEEDMKNFLQNELSDDIPENYTLMPENISFTVNDVDRDEDSDEISVTLDVKAEPVFDLDKDRLLSLVKGKPATRVGRIIKDDFMARGYSLEHDTPIPLLKSIMPFFSKNIIITVESE